VLTIFWNKLFKKTISYFTDLTIFLTNFRKRMGFFLTNNFFKLTILLDDRSVRKRTK